MIRLLLALLLLPAAAYADDAPGHRIAVFDTTLHMLCTGTGASVILEAGLGGNYLDWTLVQPALSRNLHVCSYDRAGAGFSARTARPRSVENIAGELHALVLAAGVPTPFILVGHSFGGLTSLDYARRYPADVAALVLVDAMHPEQFDRFAAAGVQIETDPLLVLGRTSPYAAAYGLPDALRRLAIDLAQADKARVFMVREMAMMQTNAHAVRDAGLPHLPARVLVHGRDEWHDVPPPGAMERVWRDMQADLASRLGAPAPTIVADSGHQIALDRPDAVIDAVEALATARTR